VARVLRKHRPQTRIVVCEPDNSQVLGSGIGQTRLPDGTPAASHPLFRPHLMQGWSPDFIPKLTEDAMTLGLVDEVRPVNGAEALRLARALATEEGILAGISGGATLAGALEVARELPTAAVVLCMLPDTGERYLSTPLFAEIPVDMTEEELALSRSTPGARFDTPPPVAVPEPAAAPVTVTPDAERFVTETIGDSERPVVMFALEWCEFCWSVRRMLTRFGVAFRSIDLDAVEFQAGDRGGAIRAALTARTGVKTLPQIFIGGEFIGGSTDLMDAWRAGKAQVLLERHGVAFDRAVEVDPRTFLPAWLQPRTAA
jgi:cysteine synthase A